jgi:hypothetical protein
MMERVVSPTLLALYFQYKIHPISIGQLAGWVGSEGGLVEWLRVMFLPLPTIGVKLSGCPTGSTATNQTAADRAVPNVAYIAQPQ